MTWRSDYDNELAHVFREAERLIDAYPAPLNDKGRDYLQAFNPLNPSGTKNHICYLLPFWMQPITELDSRYYRDLSLANVFVMLYFFIQDDLMDTAPSDWKEQLALGNLFHLSMLDLYRALFESSSPFWDYYRAYVTDWSLSVAYESPHTSLSPAKLAQKAAPVKLASTGALLLAGRRELEPAVSDGVDLVLATLQMSDDWSDWEEDFELQNANSLIGMIASEKAASPSLMTRTDIRNAIYIDGALSRYTQVAQANGEAFARLELSLPHLAAFQSHLSDKLTEESQLLSDTKKKLLGGGFTYWISQNKSFD
ncbi:hypothetical protein [Paenibacillus sp. CF384]|uniref:hypothetical protein n=1 Tax=Paenibacillus sp. CF384 TaxID=1884382 RepID=UPI00089BB6FA|nr:hypothetical protein [Paenibacillus sp. CF384]SDW08280.1 hypothetical protein SAMN05518855_1001202 [Paenibacillus sp. CF384]